MSGLARIFKALSDENRLAIFELIRKCCGDCCKVSDKDIDNTVTEIARHFSLSLSTVSHHLKELRNAGLIECRKNGRLLHCAVNREALEQIDQFTSAAAPDEDVAQEVTEDVAEEARDDT